MMRAVVTLSLLLGLNPIAQAGQLERVIDQQGTLSKDDQQLPDGSYMDVYPIDLVAGDRVLIELTGRKMDTLVVLRSPTGQTEQNDDAGDKSRSELDVIVEETGTYLVYATTFPPNEKGAYTLRASVDRSGRGSATRPAPTSAPTSSSSSTLAVGVPTQGRLESGDQQLNSGEWADGYALELQAGQRISVDLTSDAFDTYVALSSPTGKVYNNDDFDGSRNHSRWEGAIEESGTWTVVATTFAPAQGGAYTLRVDTGAAPTASAKERWSGSLASGDATVSSGELMDQQRISGQVGEHWVLDLRANGFDPFLIVRSPSGEQLQNDDFEGANDRSVLDMTLTEAGEYLVVVTTYRPGEVGGWDLSLERGATAPQAAATQRFAGTLGDGAETLSAGEWYRVHEVEGVTGQNLRVAMTGDFDTYLALVGPNDFKLENDDAPAGGSAIETVLPESGTYRIVATSYKAGQGGAYTITVDNAAAAAPQRDSDRLTSGAPVHGRLEAGDRTLETGEFQDTYTIEARAGQLVAAQVRTTDFDPYIGMQAPNGDVLENDDWSGQRDTARVELTAPVDGRYRVIATSYVAGAVGNYEVSAVVGGQATATAQSAAPTSTTRTFGVFMGISDYPANGPSDLDFTADDAREMYAGMQRVGMRPTDGRLLVDADATVGAFTAAVRELAAQMDSDDRLVLFYSGHGGRLPALAAQATDPDGFDETLALYDGQLRDDELASLLGEVQQGMVLLVLDSCFSGGFSKDVITRPGRMGLFSSQEDVTSAVALKFRAGGYLARFMVEALSDRRADDDGDAQVTALELSQFLYERYRADVRSPNKAAALDDIVLSGQNLGYQQIVVDRGGVGPSQVLFTW